MGKIVKKEEVSSLKDERVPVIEAKIGKDLSLKSLATWIHFISDSSLKEFCDSFTRCDVKKDLRDFYEEVDLKLKKAVFNLNSIQITQDLLDNSVVKKLTSKKLGYWVDVNLVSSETQFLKEDRDSNFTRDEARIFYRIVRKNLENYSIPEDESKLKIKETHIGKNLKGKELDNLVDSAIFNSCSEFFVKNEMEDSAPNVSFSKEQLEEFYWVVENSTVRSHPNRIKKALKTTSIGKKLSLEMFNQFTLEVTCSDSEKEFIEAMIYYGFSIEELNQFYWAN